MNMKEESEKVGLKVNIQKTKIMASDPITSKVDGETMEPVTNFIFGLQNHCKITPKSSQAMKLKDTCSLEEKIWPT